MRCPEWPLLETEFTIQHPSVVRLSEGVFTACGPSLFECHVTLCDLWLELSISLLYAARYRSRFPSLRQHLALRGHIDISVGADLDPLFVATCITDSWPDAHGQAPRSCN